MTALARACSVALLALLLTVVGALIAVPPAVSAPTASIAGTVTGGGAPVLTGTEIYVLRQSGSDWESVGPRVFADADGSYAATGLVAGTYRLLFEPDGIDWLSEWWQDADSLETATDLVLREGEQRDLVDADLRPAGHLVGTVHGPDGRPVAAALVTAFASTDGPPNGASRGTDTGSSGNYDLGHLAPGTYRLQFEDELGDLPGEFWNDRPTFATATDIVVGLGQTVVLGDTVLGTPPPVVTPPAAAPVVANTAAPRISGKAVVGKVLEAGAGSWTPSGLTYAYQWFASGTAIKGATKSRLKLRRTLQGKKVTVRVTASAAGVTPVTATSKATKKVRPRR